MQELDEFVDILVVEFGYTTPFHIFTRSYSRPEAVKIIPVIDDGCSRKAVVTSVGSSSHKTSAIVLAQEISKCIYMIEEDFFIMFNIFPI